MPRCEEWEWEFIPCQCALRDCQFKAEEKAQAAREAVLALAGVPFFDVLRLQREVEAIFNGIELEYHLCALAAARCNGVDFRPAFVDQDEVRRWRNWKYTFEGVAIALEAGALVAGILEAPLVGAFLAGAGIGAVAGALVFDILADNPDYYLFENLLPVSVPIERLTVGPADELGPDLTDSLNRVLAHQADSIVQARGLSDALTRARRALVAGDTQDRDSQLVIAHGFAAQWAELLDTAGTLRSDAAAGLAEQDIGLVAPTLLEVLDIREAIRVDGWPHELRTSMGQLGLEAAEQDEALLRLTVGLNDLPALCKPATVIVEAAHLVPDEQELGAVLRRFAAA